MIKNRIWTIGNLPWSLPALGYMLFHLWMVISDRLFFSSDTSNLNYVLRRWHTNQIVEQSEFPLWNPNLFYGINHLGNPTAGYFSFDTLLYFLIPNYWVQHASFMLLGAIGIWGIARLVLLKVGSTAASRYAAWAFAFCGVFLSLMVNFTFFAGLCLLPAAIYCWANFTEKGIRRYLYGYVLFSLWIVFVGDYQTFGVCQSYLVLDQWKNKKAWLNQLILLPIILGLGSISWLPALEALELSPRKQLDFNSAGVFSLPFGALLQLLVPSWWGSFADGTFVGSHLIEATPFSKKFWLENIYMGLLPLALVPFVIRIKGARIPLVCAFLFLSLSLGSNFFLHGMFWDFLPGYKLFQFPSKYLAHFAFFLVLATSYYFRDRDVLAKTVFRVLGVLIGLTLVLAICRYAVADEVLRNPLLYEAAIKVGLLAFLWVNYMKPKPALILSFLVVDLFFNMPSYSKVSLSTLSKREVTNLLNSKSDKRPLVFRDALVDTHGLGANFNIDTLKHNWGQLSGVRYLFGYEPTITSDMRYLADNIFGDLERWTNVLGIQYVISIASPRESNLKRLFEEGKLTVRSVDRDNNLVVLELPKRPQFYLSSATVGDDGTIVTEYETQESNEVEVIRETNNSIQLKVVDGAGKILVQRAAWHPSWQARVNGEPRGIIRVDGINRAIHIDESPAEIVLEFKPKFVVRSVWLASAALILLITAVYLKRSPLAESINGGAGEGA